MHLRESYHEIFSSRDLLQIKVELKATSEIVPLLARETVG